MQIVPHLLESKFYGVRRSCKNIINFGLHFPHFSSSIKVCLFQKWIFSERPEKSLCFVYLRSLRWPENNFLHLNESNPSKRCFQRKKRNDRATTKWVLNRVKVAWRLFETQTDFLLSWLPLSINQCLLSRDAAGTAFFGFFHDTVPLLSFNALSIFFLSFWCLSNEG